MADLSLSPTLADPPQKTKNKTKMGKKMQNPPKNKKCKNPQQNKKASSRAF